MIWTHSLNPVALSIGDFSVRWYGIAYAVAFAVGYFWLIWQSRTKKIDLSTEEIDTLIFSVILGVIVGGRLGNFIFYSPQIFLSDPLEVLQVWHGGMSFHGGLAGVIVAVAVVARILKKNFLTLTDALTIPTAFGLALGRLANFVNGELVGRPTNGNWGVIFPNFDELPRHPSQLYELAKNLLLAGILFFLQSKKLPRGVLSFAFLVGYGVLRSTIEILWREPLDGFLLGLPAGATWSVTMIVAGGIGIFWSLRRQN